MKLLTPWALRFSIVSVGSIAVLIALAWIVFGFHSLGLDASATIALTLGIVLSVALAVGLMALMFYSDRSGRDDTAGGHPHDP